MTQSVKAKMVRQVLLDNRLTPVDKIIYISILEEYGVDIIEDLQALKKFLRVEGDGTLKELSDDRIMETFNKLTDMGYINVEGKLAPVSENSYEEKINYILDYISKSRIVRGYSNRVLSSKVYREIIRERLITGSTVEECIAVANFRFESEWHKKNHKHLIPSRIYQEDKFADAIQAIPDIQELASLEITEIGLANKVSEKVIGVM